METQAKNRSKTTSPHVNVTPLIDILLVLLIIFMVISPLKPTRFKAMISEPPPDNKNIKKSPRTLVVDIDRDLRMRLIKGDALIAEGSVSDAGAVMSRLIQEFSERRTANDWRPGMENHLELSADERIQKTVFIKAPRSVGYGEVAKAIDGVKGAGANPIGLQTDELAN